MTSVTWQQKTSSERCRAAGPPSNTGGKYLASAVSSQLSLAATSRRFYIYPSFHPSTHLLLTHPSFYPFLLLSFLLPISLHSPILPSTRPFFYPLIHPSIHPSTHPSNHLSFHSSTFQIFLSFTSFPPTHPSIQPSTHASIFPSISPSIHFPTHHPLVFLSSTSLQSIPPSIHPSIHPSTHPSLYPFIILSIHPSIFPPIHLSFPPKRIFSSTQQSFRLPILPTTYLSVHQPLHFFLPFTSFLPIHPSIQPSTHASIFLSISTSIHFPTHHPFVFLSSNSLQSIHPFISIHKYLNAYLFQVLF